MKWSRTRSPIARLVQTPLLAFVLALHPMALAADPPALLNYQGVLRDAGGAPVTGTRTMVLRFRDTDGGGCPAVGGTLLLTDAHPEVVASGGLFSIRLGGGTITPGAYADLTSMFRAEPAVFLEVEVEGELLCPRVQVASSAYALNAAAVQGRSASDFLDTSASTQSKPGGLVVGDPAFGAVAATATDSLPGGSFPEANNQAGASLGVGTTGVAALGFGAGGHFYTSNGSGDAWLGIGHVGIEASGQQAGAHFFNPLSGSDAWVGALDHGIEAYGTWAGGSFADATGGHALLAYQTGGIEAGGPDLGGRFTLDDDSAAVVLGFYAPFEMTGDGIYAMGIHRAGYFLDGDASGEASIGFGDRGIWAKGLFAGGTFSHPDDLTFWADVSTAMRKIQGTGAVSFVQNHPHEKDRVLVYAAPEGDEVAVYTRGSARLTDGVARVKLGPTFAWVANPDLGLTAHLTPRGEAIPLGVESVGTDEIVVRGPAGSNAAFDYLVYGLRVGFEEAAVVQPKDREAFLPAPGAVAADYGGRTDLHSFNALERFRGMRADLGEPGEADLSRAHALAAAIDAGRAEVLAAAGAVAMRRRAEVEEQQRQAGEPKRQEAPSGRDAGAAPPRPEFAARRAPPVAEPEEPGAALAPGAAPVLLAVSEAVEKGDLLTVDTAHPGELRRADAAFDPGVAAIATGPAAISAERLQAPVTDSRYAWVKVDASLGPIRPGDLLTASPTPGHAMRVPDGGSTGALIGKALERLDSGTGLLRILVLLR